MEDKKTMIYWKNRTIKLKRSKTSKQRGGYIVDFVALDTETTSGFIDKKGNFELFDKTKKPKYYKDKIKVGFVYIWMVAINDVVYFGRELEELKQFLFELDKEADGQKIVIYVHNLGFDFQFLRNVFTFKKVFARTEREPITAEIDGTNIILKCSYTLSAMGLEMTAKKHNLNVQKLVGDLDYSKARNTKTELTQEELNYCANDVLVINAFIKKMFEQYGSFKSIPLTNTGIVRKKFKEWIEQNYKGGCKNALYKWQKWVASLTEDTETFILLVKAFAGGYTHGNALKVNQIMYNVNADDFTSSYPAVLLTEKFPCTSFWKDENAIVYKDELGQEFDTLDYENKAYLLTLQFTNICNIGCNSFISLSKCADVSGIVIDNGRVSAAEFLQITITEQDYLIIKENYTFDTVKLIDCRSANKDYLPQVYYTFILELYRLKQELKEQKKKIKKEFGDKSQEYKEICTMYDNAKAHVNALYGMACTNYISDVIEFNDEWQKTKLNLQMVSEQLEKLKEQAQILLPYSFGVWCTAYARKNLWYMINKLNNDLIYTDTDSVYYINDHQQEIEEYNKMQYNKLCKALKHHGLDMQEWLADLGAFDAEHRNDNPDTHIYEFKALGAKKYAYIDKTGKHITVSGVNKKEGINAFDTLEEFKNGLVFDYTTSGKKTKAYNDEQPQFAMVDYQGNGDIITQKCGICIYPTTYTLDATGEFKDLVEEVQNGVSYCELLQKL